jgi:hypothetical protein
MIILSLPEVRTAEILTSAVDIETADGMIRGRPGDVAVTSGSGERYPIRADIFYGAYDVVARVGSRMVARRLVHVRRAWTVTSADAEFSYGADRGLVPAAQGSWVYQSDDDDFGAINSKENLRAHAEVCSPEELDSANWLALVRRRVVYLAALPAILALLALAALVSSATPGLARVGGALLGLEVVLLIGGAAMVWDMRSKRWGLRAAAQVALNAGKAFQCAVELLGHRPSERFPGMALWRAAQMDPPQSKSSAEIPPTSEVLFKELRAELGRTIQEADDSLKRNHRLHRLLTVLSLGTIAAITLCNSLAILSHSLVLEAVAIWIPSGLAAIHTLMNRTALFVTTVALSEYTGALRFFQTRLFTLTHGASLSASTQPGSTEVHALLRALCRAVGTYTQVRLRIALNDSPEPPA